mmetsp:Transcript_13346/g.52253  ORF Transcript_13346/g.52253 Transcript_13346/m.52253 type:complete len:409 (+) Transcript_13346:871-2097(+)
MRSPAPDWRRGLRWFARFGTGQSPKATRRRLWRLYFEPPWRELCRAAGEAVDAPPPPRPIGRTPPRPSVAPTSRRSDRASSPALRAATRTRSIVGSTGKAIWIATRRAPSPPPIEPRATRRNARTTRGTTPPTLDASTARSPPRATPTLGPCARSDRSIPPTRAGKSPSPSSRQSSKASASRRHAPSRPPPNERTPPPSPVSGSRSPPAARASRAWTPRRRTRRAIYRTLLKPPFAATVSPTSLRRIELALAPPPLRTNRRRLSKRRVRSTGRRPAPGGVGGVAPRPRSPATRRARKRRTRRATSSPLARPAAGDAGDPARREPTAPTRERAPRSATATPRAPPPASRVACRGTSRTSGRRRARGAGDAIGDPPSRRSPSDVSSFEPIRATRRTRTRRIDAATSRRSP